MDKYDEVEQKLKAWERATPKATLTEMEVAVDQELAKLRRKILEEMVDSREKGREQAGYQCPNCNREMVGNGYKKGN